MESIFVRAAFSPKELQLLVVSAVGLLVLDAKTENTLSTFLRLRHFNFISDKECVIAHTNSTLQLFHLKSGKVLSAFDVESVATCSAVCFLNRRLFGIRLQSATSNFKVFRVHLLRGEYALSIFKRKCREMLVMFSGICYHTQEKEIKRKLQCKVQKLTNAMGRFYAAIHLY